MFNTVTLITKSVEIAPDICPDGPYIVKPAKNNKINI